MAEVDARSQRRTEINKATAETTAEIARSLRDLPQARAVQPTLWSTKLSP